jgi:type III restriction enzyme
MSNPFFDHPILNSPYDYPSRHWELDEAGQPTQKTIERRRPAKSTGAGLSSPAELT